MKKSISTISAVLVALTFAFHSPANAAEQQPAPDQKAAEGTTKAKVSDSQKRMRGNFRCGPTKCACDGKRDCDDLGSTGLCKGPVEAGRCDRK